MHGEDSFQSGREYTGKPSLLIAELFLTGCLCFQISNDELLLDADRRRLCAWQAISERELEEVFLFAAVVEVDKQDIENAKSLIRWCLMGDPKRRPSIEQMLAHRFVDPGGAEPIDSNLQAVAFHAKIQARDTDGVIAMMESGAAHPSMVLANASDVLPLHRAVKNGDLRMVQAIVEATQAEVLGEALSVQTP